MAPPPDRTCGLSIANLIEAEGAGRRATGHGERRSTPICSGPGGGGGFGVATSFLFKLHPVARFMRSMIRLIEQAAEIMRWYLTSSCAPEELNGWFILECAVSRYSEDGTRRTCAPSSALYRANWQAEGCSARPAALPPAIDFVGSLPYDGLQSIVRHALPAGLSGIGGPTS
jgi:hypothetical protein